MKKYYFLFGLLSCLLLNKSYGIEYKVPPGHPLIEDTVQSFAESIASHCNFNRSKPVEVILDSDDLISKLKRDNLKKTYQYLLTRKAYFISEKLSISHHATLCGLHDWMIDSAFTLIQPFSQAYNTTLADNTGAFNSTEVECSQSQILGQAFEDLADDCETFLPGEKTTIYISDTEQDRPSIVSFGDTKLRHLKLQMTGIRKSAYPILALGCTSRLTGCPSYFSRRTKSTFYNVDLEDLSGKAAHLLKVDERSTFKAVNSTFNFKHRENSSYTLYFYWTSAIRLDGIHINNSGNSGIAIYWDGIYDPGGSLPFYLKNISIQAPEDSAFTGLYLHTDRGENYVRPVEISNIHLRGGFKTGFRFRNHFSLSPDGNTGSKWESTHPQSQRCKGSPRNEILTFEDGVTCP